MRQVCLDKRGDTILSFRPLRDASRRPRRGQGIPEVRQRQTTSGSEGWILTDLQVRSHLSRSNRQGTGFRGVSVVVKGAVGVQPEAERRRTSEDTL
jgi:hypothetical protein